jgi:hypothetical protein
MASILDTEIAEATAKGQHAHHRGWSGSRHTWVIDTDLRRALECMRLTGTRTGFLCSDPKCVYAGVNPMHPLV